MGHTQELILKSLENLTTNELRKFELKLCLLPPWGGFNCIPRGAQLPLDALDFTNRIANFYLEDYEAAMSETESSSDTSQCQTQEILLPPPQLLPLMGPLDSFKSQVSGCGSDGNVAQSTPIPTPTSTPSGIHFVDKHWTDFINYVIQLDPVLDKLCGNVLNEEQCQEVRAEDTNLDKMRKLYSFMEDWDLSRKDLFLKALKET
ncbi:apoptosis-associated speck-like protein containing a CARD isoform X1 [Petaurus breviceps papuanus]|uniref:apoptosis-associated speck-like protein containing a CARD isoform X1 n=1 Tax=Petaurus breviceps papuanus TaxID=3040969 RepID=UPI0036D961EA